MKQKKKVLIIGSGVSGLAAAKTLCENKYEVQIFEARDDHGGRIKKNVIFSGFPIDIGAEEIHQTQCSYHQLAISIGATFVPDDEFKHYFEDIMEEVLVERESFFQKYKEYWYYESIIQNLQSLDDEMSLEQYFKQKNLPQAFYPLYENFWGVENGGSLHEISVKSYGQYETGYNSDHDTNLIVTNMSQFDILEKIFSEQLKLIQYKTPITKIEYFKNENNCVRIYDCYDNIYEGDYLIITVPISQLQNNSITFIPELPIKKQEAIQKIKFGKGGKLHLKFKTDFWPCQTRNIILRSKISFLWKVHHVKPDNENEIVIACLVAGDVMEELQNFDQRYKLIDELLEKLSRLFKSPNIKNELIDILWSDFTKQDFIEGVYSIPSINLGESRKIYQEPLLDILFFAGEASSEKYSMTIHGAYDSGLRDAYRIIQQQN